MYTVTHGLISAKTGETVQVTFTVTDGSGNAVSVEGAAATYKIARRAGDTAILAKTEAEGISLVSNMAIVEFDTGDLADAEGALLGDFFAQLTITKDGDGLVVSEGPLHVSPVIL